MPTPDFYQAERPSQATRIVLALMASGLVLVFVVAMYLNPDPRGFGTHQQLGLPACQFRQFTGLPCPHCGMTTSFSNFVRGEFVTAWQANPAGVPLACICLCCVPVFYFVAVTGRWVLTPEPFRWFLTIGLSYLSFAFIVWILRLIF